MLQEHLAIMAGNAIETGLAERRAVFAREAERIRKDVASMGTLSSGLLIERIRKLCESEVDARAQLIAGQLLRVAPADGSVPTLAGDLKEELRKYLPVEPADLSEAYEAVTRGVPGLDRRGFSLARARDEAIRKADAQLDAFVTGLGRPKPPPPANLPTTQAQQAPAKPIAPQVQQPIQPLPAPHAGAAEIKPAEPPPNKMPPSAPPPAVQKPQPSAPSLPSTPTPQPQAFAAPVTPPPAITPSTPVAPAPAGPSPQTVPRSAGGTSRPLSPDEKDRIGRALQLVRNEIERWPEIGGFSRYEVVTLIEEARAELIKEYASRFRLIAVVAGLSAVAGFTAEVTAAYNEVRAAMIVAGLTAPPPERPG